MRARRRELLLNLPIAWRLTFGFLLAAAIAAAATGASYLQRAQSLANEASFYQSLLASNTALNTGANFLQLMDTKLHDTLLDAAAPKPSQETLTNDQTAIQGLESRYDAILADYARNSPVDLHPEQVALLTEAGHASQVTQQRTLISSVVRSWQVYRVAQHQVLADIAAKNIAAAAALERAQAEPTHADALSAARALIQFDGHIAGSVHDAAVVEQQNQLFTVIIAAVLAFLAIAAVGWVISDTLVRRLRQLREVLLDVDQGEIGARVVVVGRDEIGGVSASVNRMLDTIVGLLQVTRRQHDAMVHAAERLFSDVRVAGAGDLRTSATVGSDPIGMLANAFNFTVGRFRRFVVRTQGAVNQLDVVTRQQHDRSLAFLTRLQQMGYTPSPSSPFGSSAQGALPDRDAGRDAGRDHPDWPDAAPTASREAGHARELVRLIASEEAPARTALVLDLAEQAYVSAGRLSQVALRAITQRLDTYVEQVVQTQMQELRILGNLLARLGSEAQALQATDTGRLAELDAVLARLEAAVNAGAVSAPSGAATVAASWDGQLQDMLRLSTAFARDMATVARQVVTLTEEIDARRARDVSAGGWRTARPYALCSRHRL